jgi:WD40 repeat protein
MVTPKGNRVNPHTLQGHSDRLSAVAGTPDGRYAVSGSRDNTLRLWDLATGETKRTLQAHTDWVTAIAAVPDGRHLVSGSRDNTLRVWDLATGETKGTRLNIGH